MLNFCLITEWWTLLWEPEPLLYTVGTAIYWSHTITKNSLWFWPTVNVELHKENLPYVVWWLMTLRFPLDVISRHQSRASDTTRFFKITSLPSWMNEDECQPMRGHVHSKHSFSRVQTPSVSRVQALYINICRTRHWIRLSESVLFIHTCVMKIKKKKFIESDMYFFFFFFDILTGTTHNPTF